MASIGLPLPRRPFRFSLQHLSHWTALALLLVLVVWPVALILLNSFQLARPGQAPTYSLDAWRVALSDPALLRSVSNTVQMVVARQAIAFPVAILIAWVLARTDVPGSQWLEFLFWIAFFLPALPVTLGWILLLDPEYGLINQLFTLLPFMGKSTFNIYSFWGIVWAHLAGGTIAIKVMLLTPAFRNMDASLEEASRVAGASTLGTLRRVVIPVMTPILTVTLLLSIIHSMQSFEIELILGLPFRFFVFSTQIYALIHQEPPLFPAATALSSMILGLMVPLIALQRWATGRRRYATVTGHFKGHKVKLGKWRLPVFFLVLGSAVITTLVPFVFLVIGTFMRLFGFFNLAQAWTTVHWSRVFDDPIFFTSVKNTLILAGGTALTAVILFTLVSYIVVRTRFAARAALDFISWLPSTLPGIILALGLLWLFLGTAVLRPAYGTVFILIIGTVISSMPLGVQIIKANFTQLGFELEEAARIAGGSWWPTFRHVMLPLIAPTLLLVGTVSFISAAKNVATVALIPTSGTRPLSLLQLDFMVEGRYESAAVVGVIVVAMTTGIAFIARFLGLRVGLAN